MTQQMTFCSHDLLKTITFYQHFFVAFLAPVIILIFQIDNCTLYTVDTLEIAFNDCLSPQPASKVMHTFTTTPGRARRS